MDPEFRNIIITFHIRKQYRIQLSLIFHALYPNTIFSGVSLRMQGPSHAIGSPQCTRPRPPSPLQSNATLSHVLGFCSWAHLAWGSIPPHLFTLLENTQLSCSLSGYQCEGVFNSGLVPQAATSTVPATKQAPNKQMPAVPRNEQISEEHSKCQALLYTFEHRFDDFFLTLKSSRGGWRWNLL